VITIFRAAADPCPDRKSWSESYIQTSAETCADRAPSATPRALGTQPSSCSSKDSPDAIPRSIESLIFALTFRHQVDCWLSPQIRERQMRTGWIHLMQPVQQWLRGHYYIRGSVNEFHGFRNATRLDGSSSTSRLVADAVGLVHGPTEMAPPRSAGFRVLGDSVPGGKAPRTPGSPSAASPLQTGSSGPGKTP